MFHRNSNVTVFMYDRFTNKKITSLKLDTAGANLIGRLVNLSPAKVRKVLSDDCVQLLGKTMYFVGQKD
jgi:hypothetical protein